MGPSYDVPENILRKRVDYKTTDPVSEKSKITVSLKPSSAEESQDRVNSVKYTSKPDKPAKQEVYGVDEMFPEGYGYKYPPSEKVTRTPQRPTTKTYKPIGRFPWRVAYPSPDEEERIRQGKEPTQLAEEQTYGHPKTYNKHLKDPEGPPVNSWSLSPRQERMLRRSCLDVRNRTLF